MLRAVERVRVRVGGSAVANGRSSLPMRGDTTVTPWPPWVAAPLYGAGCGMGRRTDEVLQTLEPMDDQGMRRPCREKHASDASREREEESPREAKATSGCYGPVGARALGLGVCAYMRAAHLSRERTAWLSQRSS